MKDSALVSQRWVVVKLRPRKPPLCVSVPRKDKLQAERDAGTLARIAKRLVPSARGVYQVRKCEVWL